ncbi:Serine/threonine protein kinase [Candidatus Sulfopaludibacter sp. SbA6]|nr:Serine/threonine protein kinase [Candidatus Sulfopaludibacter sp. SbA6]
MYRARDSKLNRNVAIKVIPESFAQDPDRLARFTREAQVLASLNHPNIAAIYGVEDRALVLELVEGPTLAERIAAGPIPLDEALPIAKQVAEALEYAHEKGIVHRDLKPANVKVTPEGRAKVLDFGLAKALASEPSQAEACATMTMGASVAGVIMGTPSYMSPEQAKGKPVDRRADIWAFGVLVAEMLSGKQMYAGETVSETLASVIKDVPDLDALPAETPAGIRKMLRRCLDKDPRRRLQAIGEARFALEEVLAGALAEEPAVIPASQRSGVPFWVAGLLALAAVSALALLWRATRPVDRPLMRFSADLGPDAVAGLSTTAILSPDGTRIAFPVHGANGVQIATRLIDQSKATILSGTEGATDPFFSPDGQWIGFGADQKLKKISVRGGAPVTLCEATSLRGAAWGEDGNIIATLDLLHLFRIPAAGGTPQLLAKPEDKGLRTYRWPQILPGGDTLLVTAHNMAANYEDANIAAVSLKTGQVKVVQRGGYFGRYLPSGHLIYVRQGTLFAVPFDLKRLETTGMPAPQLEDVAGSSVQGGGQLDFSQSGTLVYLAGRSSLASESLVWMDGAGKQVPLFTVPGLLVTPRFSPDGKRLALAVNGDISVYDLERGALSRITFTSGALNRFPVWTPDGRHIVFAPTAGTGLWRVRADGSGQPEHILETLGPGVPGSFSPDGKRLAYHQGSQGTARDIWILPLDTTDPDHPKPGKPELFLGTPGSDIDPAFSPDGRWMAYASDESGSFQVYVRPSGAPVGSGGKWQISTTPGRFPIWSPNRKELFFESLDGHIQVADYTVSGEAFVPGRPRQWCDTPISTSGNFANLDLAPDGKRFVVFPLPEGGGADKTSLHVTFLLNFFDELRRKMPPGGK